MKKLSHFELPELVCPDVYEYFGEQAWQFLDPRLLETIEVVREEIIARPMTINNWHIGGTLTQRGLRCNLCPLVFEKSLKNKLYLSAHNMGKAIDFSVGNTPAQEIREKIIEQGKKLPHPIRLENNVSWIHLDVYDNGKSKIYCFNA